MTTPLGGVKSLDPNFMGYLLVGVALYMLFQMAYHKLSNLETKLKELEEELRGLREDVKNFMLKEVG